MEHAHEDPLFGEKFVREYMQLKSENEALKKEVATAKQLEQGAQQALRQARGISSYLKSKQGELTKAETKSQLALRQANGISSYLKNKNKALQDKLQDAQKHEIEAQLALRQAKGVSAYLKSKNASLEKKLAASQSEKKAEAVFKKAHRASMELRNSLHTAKETEIDVDDHSEEQPSLQSTDDEMEKSNDGVNELVKSTLPVDPDEPQVSTGLTTTQVLYMVALVAIGAGTAYRNRTRNGG